VHNNDRVVVLCSHCKDKIIPIGPRRQVLPVNDKAHVFIANFLDMNRKTHLSPPLPSTVMYSSPLSAFKKTKAADLFLAIFPARGRSKSSSSQETLVLNFLALCWIASRGWSKVAP